MSVTYIGFGVNTALPADARVRVTFGEAFSLNPDGLFAQYFPPVLDKLAPIAGVIPLNRPTVPSGDTSVTVDGVSKHARSGGDLIESLIVAARGNFVEVRSVQLLTGDDAKNVTSDSGAAARDATALASKIKAEAESIVTRTANALGTSATVVKYAAIALLFVALAYLANTFKRKG